MKRFPFFKQAVALLIASFCAVMSIQAAHVSINISSAGRLSSELPSTGMDSLTITGPLNNSDFNHIKNNLPQLAYLNLLDATVTNNTVPNSALSNKTSLKEVILPATVVSIDSYTFDGCSSLSTINLPDGLQTIGYAAFNGCALADELLLPESLTSIGSYAFQNNKSLTKVIFPEGLQTIGSSAFRYCSALSGELVLPASLKTIDSYTFSDCFSLTSCNIKATTPPTISDDYYKPLGYINTVFVPQGSLATYKANANWNQKLIIEGEPRTVSVTLTQAGTLGAKVMEQAESMYAVNHLIVSGPFNDTDWSQLKTMTNLISIDVSATTATAVPNNQFQSKPGLLDIKLPNNLVTIGDNAFNSCSGLQKIEIPATVTSIGSAAFAYCYGLDSIIIPDEVTIVRGSTFYNCYSLKQVTFPANLIQIESSAFAYCTALLSIQLPNALTTLGSEAFRNCPIDSITLPAALMNIGSGALNRATIKKITCLQPTPPVLSSDPFSSVNKKSCELIVPFWAEISYKLANIWLNFENVSAWNNEIDYLPVSGSLIFIDNVRPLGNPTVEIMTRGNLTVWGNAPFNTNDFILRHQLRTTSTSSTPYYSQLISESSTTTAQHAQIDMTVYGNRWYYLSFPFDVAVADISIDEGTSYVFRYYDGASRAAIGTGSSWKNVAQTDTLYAGTGYIFQCSKDGKIVLPATNTSKNRLFIPISQSIALNEYPAEKAADRNWNLTGNPFPSYYDIRYMDYSAPITYWNDRNRVYEAVSPLDDAFVLEPMQAFFVQKPEDLDAIIFTPDGRQTSATAQQYYAKPSTAASSFRTLINVTLGDENYSDKSRIVLNPDAQPDYETERDAAKFMSTATEVPQLYSMNNADNVRYAINERPVSDGIIPLGIYTGNAGNFNIALQEPVDGFEIVLKDKQSGNTVDLSSGAYTFYSEAGSFDNRFGLQIIEAGGRTTGCAERGYATVKVYAAQGAIVVENATGAIDIYSINGAKVAAAEAAETQQTVSVPQGVYMVTVNGKSYKILVNK